MRETARGLLVQVGWGLGLALALFIAERLFGLSGALRFWVGGIAVVIGSLLFSSNPARILYTKGRVRGVTDRDVEEVFAARRANVSSGTRLLIVGAVLVISSFIV